MPLPPLPTFAEIIEQAPDAILLVEASGAIAYANQRVADLFGLSPADLRGQSIEVLIPERLRPQHAAHRATYARAPRIRPMGDNRLALTARRADGTEFPVDIQLAPIESAGRHWTLAVVRDATERHRFLEELRNARHLAERVARLKGEFLSMAAHDLSQPVQTLEFLISTIERSAPPGSEVAAHAVQAMATLEPMRRLLKMLSDISRLESGTWQINPEPVQVDEVFGELERQFGPLAQAKALHFASKPCLHIIETDPGLLRALLSNLVANAIRYTPRGEVRVQCLVPADGSLRLSVSDTGIGIPADQLQRVFEDFHRLEEARRMYRDGFGLGLGIVRRLSGLLELPVTVQSAVGSGSTFNVDIPAAKVFRAA